MATQIERLPWIGDGIQSEMEVYAVLGLIAAADAGHLAKLIEEPWVVEGRNHSALYNIGVSNVSFDPTELIEWVIHHPALNDGITYQESKILASIGRPDDASRLDPESPHTIEERTLALPLAGDVELTIIYTDPDRGYAGMMDDLEHSVRSYEDFMGLPFPQRQVIYVIEQGSGANWSPNFVYVGDSYREGPYPHTIAHEAAHYYWIWPKSSWSPNNAAWAHEGAAELLAHGPEAARDELTEFLENSECAGLTIRQLEAAPTGEAPACWYPLGEAFYRDLYRAMDPINFRLAFRRWLLHGLVDVVEMCSVEWRRVSMSYCLVREAYTTYASEENRSSVEDIINRWYGVMP